jgi:hypothetical protein
MSALIVSKLKPRLTDEPQSFNELRETLKFSDAPIRKSLIEIINTGKCDKVWGRAKNGSMCWLYFKCEKRVIVPDIPPEVKLSHLVMSKPWDGDIFREGSH